MIIATWLVEAMVKLQKAEVPNGRKEALILLADFFGKDKSWVHAHPETEIPLPLLEELNFKLSQRVDRIPLAYIRGFVEFYGRQFMVNPDVLIPRPESESFIDLLKDLQIEAPKIADIGTGSGCVGITAALEIPNSFIDLYDSDRAALDIAKYNARKYVLELKYIEADLLSDLNDTYDVILANLPYVPEGMITSPEITHEPSAALFSGYDGLDHYRHFWQQVGDLAEISKPKYLLTESLDKQHKDVQMLAKKAGYKLQKTDILVQLFELE